MAHLGPRARGAASGRDHPSVVASPSTAAAAAAAGGPPDSPRQGRPRMERRRRRACLPSHSCPLCIRSACPHKMLDADGLKCFVSAGYRGRFDLPCRVGDRSDLDAARARLAHRTAGGQDRNLPGELLHGVIERCRGPAVFAGKGALLLELRLEAGPVKEWRAREPLVYKNEQEVGANFAHALVFVANPLTQTNR